MQKNELIRLTVSDLNNLGCGVGHLENAGEESGKTVFVAGCVTGDEIEARVIKINKGYLVGKLERVLKPSPYRTDDFCTAAMSCGGCVYRCVDYAHELKLKRGYVQNAFRKAGLADVTVEPVRTTGEITGYRNKAQYPVALARDGSVTAGFYAVNSHRVVPAERCALQPPVFGEIVSFLCRYAGEHGATVYDEATGKGLLRHLYLRKGTVTGEVMVCLVVNGERFPGDEMLYEELKTRFPCVTSLFLNQNRANTNVVLGKEYRLLGGKPYLEDELCGLRFRVSPQSFYQVNHNACELLYGIAKERAALTGDEWLVDLYCGIGTIGLSMADRAREVLGVEMVPEAVECARENAARNGIQNATFLCADAGDPASLLSTAGSHVDLSRSVVILDPPRKGTTRELIEAIDARRVLRVVYVSCNPDTLARDCAIFRDCGYEIGTAAPVDLFPRTGHVECVVLMTK